MTVPIPDLSFAKFQHKPRSKSIKMQRKARLKENLVNLVSGPTANYK